MSDSQRVHYGLAGPGIPGRFPVCGSTGVLIRWNDNLEKLTCLRCRDRLFIQAVDDLPDAKEIKRRLLGFNSWNDEDSVNDEHHVALRRGVKYR